MRAQLVQMKLEEKFVENCTVHIDAVAGKDEPDYKVVERSGVLRWKSVKGMTQAVLRSKAGLAWQQQPIGFFLVLGLASESKTELGKALAKELFDDEKLLVRINMSECMEQHLVAGPIDDAPPGVILFDDLDKADAKVLFQVLDECRIMDGQGRTVNFINTMILMTSNLVNMQQVCGESSIRRWIEKRVMTKLSLIEEEIDEKCTVHIEAHTEPEDELAYKVERSGGPVNAETGENSNILMNEDVSNEEDSTDDDSYSTGDEDYSTDDDERSSTEEDNAMDIAVSGPSSSQRQSITKENKDTREKKRKRENDQPQDYP